MAEKDTLTNSFMDGVWKNLAESMDDPSPLFSTTITIFKINVLRDSFRAIVHFHFLIVISCFVYAVLERGETFIPWIPFVSSMTSLLITTMTVNSRVVNS